MPNLELDFPTAGGRKPLAGFRLHRLELLNWGTFDGKVAIMAPEGRWTLLVGENGSGKSTAVDALRTLLVPPRLLNYNDASGEQKRRDRTRRSYVRGTWATTSHEESSAAIPRHLREAGQYSILLAVFGNEHTGEFASLAQILWELNEKVFEIYAVARADRSIREHLSELGQSRDLKKELRKRGFEAFDSFSAYAEVFRSRLRIASATALEVFNQAIGVKEVTEINHFVRRHMLEGSDALDFIHNRLRPHFNELDACWRAIEKAEKQLEALAPIVACHHRIEEAETRRIELDGLLKITPIYYAHCHCRLRERAARALAEQVGALTRQRESLTDVKTREERERDARLQEIATDSTQQSIQRIQTQLEAANERLAARQRRSGEVSSWLRSLDRVRVVESEDQFLNLKHELASQRGTLESNRSSFDEKRTRLRMEQEAALRERGNIAAELESLRQHRVLIPRTHVMIREAVSRYTGISAGDLPFAGELMEVRQEYRNWAGAIERLLHQFGVSLLVPERHYLPVAKFINENHLHLRFVFHRVPAESGVFRPDHLQDSTRVAGRLNFREDHALADWVKGEITRRFNHICCENLQRMKEVDYGLTQEGLIRDGRSRHIKDDRRAVNDATNFVLGWSVEDKIQALMKAFAEAEATAAKAGQKAAEADASVRRCEAQLQAIEGVLKVEAYAEIDCHSIQLELARLNREKTELERSSERLQVLREQLNAVKQRLERLETQLDEVKDAISRARRDEETNAEVLARLQAELESSAGFDPEPVKEIFQQLQEAGSLSLEDVADVEKQVGARIQGQINNQTALINRAREQMLPRMGDFVRDYPEHSGDLQAEPSYARDFASLRQRIADEELPGHKQRFEEFLSLNLIGDMAMFHTNLLEHEKRIRHRVESVNGALRKIPFSDSTHVQIVAQATRTDEIRQFRAELKSCFDGGLNPSQDDRLRIFSQIRLLIEKFERDDVWTRRVTDARNWLEFGVREIDDASGGEVNYFSASSGKSGGQKAKLAFTILASAIAAQYGLLDADTVADTFRLVVIDEAFARTDEANSQRALELFKGLGLQLIVVNPFDAKGRIVEDYVHSFHLTVNPDGNGSKLQRASREEYDAALKAEPANVEGAPSEIPTETESVNAES